jgi:hypothetical protein
MAEQKQAHAEIDWSTAEVRDGELVVELAGEPTQQWAKHVAEVVERLERHTTGSWDSVEITKERLKVTGVQAGSEPDVRHFLEGVVQQANADFAPEHDDDADAGPSGEDASMTEAFRSFGDGDD